MAGNTLVVKHASNVPQCALAFEKLFLDAGAPAGAYTNAFFSSEQVATAIADPRVQGVALTGSERAGASVAATAGKALKKTTMELGGSDAFIVLDDADMDLAVKLAVIGRIQNAGQVCDGSKRFILVDSIADTFVERFQAELAKLPAGDGFSGHALAPLCPHCFPAIPAERHYPRQQDRQPRQQHPLCQRFFPCDKRSSAACDGQQRLSPVQAGERQQVEGAQFQ